jgi:quercetin dioxygenase-like cupin family protein
MNPRAGVLWAAILVASAATFVGAIKALAADQPVIETLLETQTTNLGQPIEYPAGNAAKITAMIVSLAPGEETGRHRHAVPLYGQVLSSQVTIDYGEHGSKTYKAGEAFMEAVGTWHNGHNSGDETLRILAIFMGAEGVPNVERP